MKKNILIIDNSAGWTGAFKSVVTVAEFLSSAYNFHFCIPKNSTNTEFITAKKFPVLTLPFIEVSKRINTVFYLPRLILNAIRIEQYCRKHKIQIIHVNDLYNLTGVVTKKMNPKVRLIHHIRLLETSYVKKLYKTWIKIIGRNADHLAAVSQIAKDNAARYTNRNIQVIYDCIPVPGSRQGITQPSSDITFLYLANYIPGKGHDMALYAFSEVVSQNPNAKLILTGDDLGIKNNIQYKQSLLKLATERGVADRIELRGFEPDVEKVMLECDVFLNFSESESFSMTCLEAIASGKPVIATNSGGPAEIVTDNYCGILIPVGDVHAAAEAMLTLSRDKNLRLRLGENGLQQAREKFNLSHEAQKLSKLYDS